MLFLIFHLKSVIYMIQNNPNCSKIIIAIGEYLVKKFKNRFNHIFYSIIEILDNHDHKLFCYGLTKNSSMPILGKDTDIFDRELIPYKTNIFMKYWIKLLINKNKIK